MFNIFFWLVYPKYNYENLYCPSYSFMLTIKIFHKLDKFKEYDFWHIINTDILINLLIPLSVFKRL
jgi:hypothetical protein